MNEPFPNSGSDPEMANAVSSRFSLVDTFIDVFGGSASALFGRRIVTGLEVLNDINGFVTNYYRAVRHDPHAVADHADWPIFDRDLVARHHWLVTRGLRQMAPLQQGNPNWFDARIAGWWLWGSMHWGRPGWCAGTGRWSVANGRVVTARGSTKVMLPSIGDATNIDQRRAYVLAVIKQVAKRLELVRITCCDWTRVVAPHLLTPEAGVFLDPPYRRRASGPDDGFDTDTSRDCRLWAIQQGAMVKIALCGFASWTCMPAGWDSYRLRSRNGGATGARRTHDAIWFSPKCDYGQRSLFEPEGLVAEGGSGKPNQQ